MRKAWWLIGCVIFIGSSAPAAANLRERLRERMSTGTETDVAAPAETLSTAPGSRWVTLTQDGNERRYLLHIPPQATRQALPLVIVLHGYGSNPEQQEQLSGFSALADKSGFAVAYPLGTGHKPQWHFIGHDDRDEYFIRAVVPDVGAQVPIDKRRVYVTGISNGAQMTARLACVAPDIFAAFALVSGNYMDFNDCKTGTTTPAILFHGTNDRILPYSGRFKQFSPQHWAEQRAVQNGCAPKPLITYRQAEVTAQSWRDCRQHAEVIFYTLAGKGHSWPGSTMPERITSQNLDATQVMWDFFSRYTR
ncbi:MAG: hypothetical protein KBA75_07930 [Alphaproteobacteria bacterium]|nr:hypothetical protein [Alphaproteobacteria bacterium]